MPRTSKPPYRGEGDPKLTGIPQDYDPAKFAKLSKDDFEDEVSFAKFELWHLERRRENLNLAIAEKQGEITALERFETEAERKAFANLQRAQARIEAEMAKLAALGHDVSTLIAAKPKADDEA